METTIMFALGVLTGVIGTLAVVAGVIALGAIRLIGSINR
jgi:hypothetical protein